MKTLLLIFLITACAHAPKKVETIDDGPVSKDDLVTLKAAVTHAQMSYLKGCVEAYKEMKIPNAFETCKVKAIFHRKEIEFVLTQPIQQINVPKTAPPKTP